MQLSCLQENLSQGLSVVQRAVATRATLPITQNVLLATDNSRLKLAATNLEIAVSTWIGAQVEGEGAVTIPARLLTDFVGSLPAERIDITKSDETASIELKCARSEAHINGQSAEDFPPIPTVEDGVIGRVDPAVLREAIGRVAFAAATEDSQTGAHGNQGRDLRRGVHVRGSGRLPVGSVRRQAHGADLGRRGVHSSRQGAPGGRSPAWGSERPGGVHDYAGEEPGAVPGSTTWRSCPS